MAIFVIILTIFAFLSVVCVKNTLNILKNDAGYVVVLDAGHEIGRASCRERV